MALLLGIASLFYPYRNSLPYLHLSFKEANWLPIDGFKILWRMGNSVLVWTASGLFAQVCPNI